MQNEIACKSYQEGRNETHTNQSETRQDCFNCHSRKFRVTIHANHSTEGEHCMKTDYQQYLEWCKKRDFNPASESEEKKYGIWNSIVHLGLADDIPENPNSFRTYLHKEIFTSN